MWDSVNVNYSVFVCVCFHGDKGTRHPVQHCGLFMCFNSFWKTKELYGSDRRDVTHTHTHNTHFVIWFWSLDGIY